MDEPGTFGQVTIPYAFSLLRHLIAGLNIELRFAFGQQDYVIAETDIPEETEDTEKPFAGDDEDDDENLYGENEEENENDEGIDDDDEDY